ncbi:MAG: PEP-CTERM sorting domain-containing protein [Opitutales bacterium]
MKYSTNLAKAFPITLLALLFLTNFTIGDIVLKFEQVGTNTVVTYDGFLNTDGFTNSSPFGSISDPKISEDSFTNLNGNWGRWGFTRTNQPVGLFTGVSVQLIGNSSSGDPFGILNSSARLSFYGPEGYSGENITGIAIFNDVNLESLGVIEQTISFGSSSGQSVIISVIPEPSSSLFLGLVAVGLVACRRRIKGIKWGQSRI